MVGRYLPIVRPILPLIKLHIYELAALKIFHYNRQMNLSPVDSLVQIMNKY